MTDDEVRAFLKPKHDWIKVVSVALAAAGIAWSFAKWAAQSPTPERVEKIQNDVFQVRLDVSSIQSDVRSMQHTIERIEKNQEVSPPPEPPRRRK